MSRVEDYVKGNAPVFIAILATFVVLVIIVLLASGNVHDPAACVGEGKPEASRFDCFNHLKPNEMGDTLAGVIGALTLVWIVASVFQQNIELRRQRQELDEMSTAMSQQTQILDAQEIREQKRDAELLMRQLLRNLANRIVIADVRTSKFFEKENFENAEIFQDATSYSPLGLPHSSSHSLLSKMYILESQAEEAVLAFRTSLYGFLELNKIARIKLTRRPSMKEFEAILRAVESIEHRLYQMPEHVSEQLRPLDIRGLKSDLIKLLEIDFWLELQAER